MKFTLKEKMEITKACKTVLKDLEAIHLASNRLPITISINIDNALEGLVRSRYFEWHSLVINQKIVGIKKSHNGEQIFYSLGKINPFGKITTDISNYLIATAFIKEYPKIREQLIKEIKVKQEKEETKSKQEQDAKEKLFSDMKKVQSQYQNEVYVELDLPKTQNRHQIEVTTEEGRQVGTIDFGGRTIKIITDGNIVLVDKSAKDNPDQKNHSKSIGQR